MEEQTVGPDLHLRTDQDGVRAVVHINGELDAYSAPGLEEEVERLIADNVSDLVLDLSGTDFLDSSGLRAILAAQRRRRRPRRPPRAAGAERTPFGACSTSPDSPTTSSSSRRTNGHDRTSTTTSSG